MKNPSKDFMSLNDVSKALKEKGAARIRMETAVIIIQGVFSDMDKDFTIWEYRKEIKELLKAGYFVNHIGNHGKREHPKWNVKCKICNDNIDKIYEQERF